MGHGHARRWSKKGAGQLYRHNEATILCADSDGINRGRPRGRPFDTMHCSDCPFFAKPSVDQDPAA
eukprot:2787608-Alexandrium_andersonii.AAC.1